ncbi:MAG: nucleoside deaminase [Pirellulaceae bacterium]
MDPETLMRQAIEMARQGIAEGQSPFGCAIARAGGLLACRHNTVLATLDSTAHAEVNALRTACLAAKAVHLPGAIVATTCEPCPMCMAALHWARVERVYFGATIQDAQLAGFHELQLPAQELLRLGNSPVQLVSGVLSDECRALFQEWLDQPGHCCY